MNKSIVAIAAAGLAGAIGFTSVASAEVTVYGRVVAGAVHSDKDKPNDDGSWNFGAVGQDGGTGFRSSRFGFKGSQDLGNGMEAGFKIEREVDGGTVKDADDNSTTQTTQRHNLVWLSGAWGKLTLGHQNNPYMNARHWDQTYFYGGAFGASYRHEGINYSMSNGPFSLNVMATAANENVVVSEGTTLHYYDSTLAAGDGATPVTGDALNGLPEYIRVADNDDNPATNPPPACAAVGNGCVQAHMRTTPGNTGTTPAAESTTTRTYGREVDDSSGVDTWILHAGYDFGPVALNVAHHANQTDATAARSRTAVGLNGSVGPLDWYLAYEASELENATGAAENDIDAIGGFVGFKMSENDTLYGYHVSHSADRNTVTGGKVTLGEDYTETIIGYSRAIGPGVRFIAEYQSLDNDLEGNDVGSDTSNLALAIKYDF